MAIIKKNENGAIAINNKVLSKLIIEELLKMSETVFFCNKKGKLIKEKPTPFIDPDYYDSIEINDSVKKGLFLNIYIIIKFGTSISQTTENIFSQIEEIFSMLDLNNNLKKINIHVKGMKAHLVIPRDIEVVKEYE